MAEALDAGHAKVWLEGEKLARRLDAAADGTAARKPQWLLIKRRDEGADARRNPESTQPESVKSGRTIEQVARRRRTRGRARERPVRGAERRRARAAAPAPAPTGRRRDEGRPHRRALQRPGLDLRAQARRHPLHRDPGRAARAAALAQRPARSTRRYPEVVDGARGRGARRGSRSTARSSRSTARRRASPGSPSAGTTTSPVFLYVVRHRSGSTARTSARCRCARASGCSAPRSPSHDGVRLHAVPQRRRARRYFAEACRKGWEGADRQARRQRRTARRARKDWLKFKCEHGPGARDRRVHGAEGLAHGVRRAAARLLRRRRVPLRGQGRDRLRPRDAARPRRRGCARSPATTRRSPTPSRSASAASPGWSPSSSPRSAFTEWTRAGRLRHPRFLGLRDDKAAGEVVREG